MRQRPAATRQAVASGLDDAAVVLAELRIDELAAQRFEALERAFLVRLYQPYVHSLRMEEAKQILETEEVSIAAVAGQVGYEDASFLGRLFRRKVGLTPAQYRRRFAFLGRTLRGPSERDEPLSDRGGFVPLLFAPYARILAERAKGLGPRSVLETAAGTGILTWELAQTLLGWNTDRRNRF